MTKDEINQIKEESDIILLIGSVIELKKRGSSYFGLCPFHNEKTPSFSVSPSKQLYHCFGCGEGGDIINFVMKYKNISFIEAVNRIKQFNKRNHNK
jgi:DNA primase